MMATDMSQFFQSLPEDTDADAEHEKYMMASALRSVGVEPFPNPGASLQADIAEAIDAEQKKDGLPDEPGDRGPAIDVAGIGEDISKGIFKGADAAGNELLQSAAFIAGAPVEAAKSAINLGLDAVGMEPIKNAFGDIDSMRRVVGVYQDSVNAVLPMPDAINEWASQPYNNEMLGELTQGITQFGVAAFPAAKMVRAMTTYNPIARGFIWGAIADFTAFNPDDPTVTNMITDHLQMAPTEERNPVLQMFLSQIEKYEDDSEFVKRAKTALDGAIFGGGIEGIGVVVRGAVNIAKKIPFDQVISSARGALDSAGQAADQRIAERVGGPSEAGSVVKKKTEEMILSEAGEAAIKDVGSIGSNIPLTKTNLEKADEVTQLLVSKILEANPDVGLSLVRSGSAAGKSNYLTFATPEGKMGQIRISDHSKGVFRSNDYLEQFKMKIPPEGEQVFGQISKKSFDDRIDKLVRYFAQIKMGASDG